MMPRTQTTHDLASGNTTTVQVPDLVPTESELIAYAAAKRYQVEVGGIVLNGQSLWTDRETQSMLSRVLQSLSDGLLTAPVRVKTPGGHVSLSQAQIEAIAAAVVSHVQACFDLEADVSDDIANDVITTYEQIDAASWPSNT